MSYQIKVIVKNGIPEIDAQTAEHNKAHVPDGTYSISGHRVSDGESGQASIGVSAYLVDGTGQGTSANWPVDRSG